LQRFEQAVAWSELAPYLSGDKDNEPEVVAAEEENSEEDDNQAQSLS
jgi:hypothetical protein